jgi:hypothetical protein
VKKAQALELGIGIHHAMERYYGYGDDLVMTFQVWATRRMEELAPHMTSFEQEKMQTEVVDLGVAMLTGYLAEYPDEAKTYEVLATEHRLAKPIPTPKGTASKCLLNARLDALVRDLRTGRIFVMEHKTFTRFEADVLDRDVQFTIQTWLGQDLAKSLGIDEPASGVVYNGLRKQMPGPRVKAALFERHPVFRHQAQIDEALLYAYHTHRRVHAKDMPIYPVPGMRCSRCDFKEPCRAKMQGRDWEYYFDPGNMLFTQRGAQKKTDVTEKEDANG